MARKKMKEEDKKVRFSITLDKDLNSKLEEYMENNLAFNKSKLIETLIKKHLTE